MGGGSITIWSVLTGNQMLTLTQEGFYTLREQTLPAQAAAAGTSQSMSTLAAGQTVQCPMNVHFDYGGKTYDLHMARTSANFPETDSVNVTCIFPTSGANPCSQWRLSPSRTYTYTDAGGIARQGLRNVANLSYETTVRGKLVYVKQGNFYVSFSIIVMNP